MCMNREAFQKLGERVGSFKEIETDESGDCIGQFARPRISVEITQLLKNVCVFATRWRQNSNASIV